jgi:hypothetical protein
MRLTLAQLFDHLIAAGSQTQANLPWHTGYVARDSAIEIVERLDPGWHHKAVAEGEGGGDGKPSERPNLPKRWLRRAGAGRIRRSDGQLLSTTSVRLGPKAMRKPVYGGISCARCGKQEVHTAGPRQRYCAPCSAELRRERVRQAMRKSRRKL